MDTAFYIETELHIGWSFGEVNFYPKASGNFWLKRVHPSIGPSVDAMKFDGNEGIFDTGIRLNFIRQGFLTISHGSGHEPWSASSSDGGGINSYGQVQNLPLAQYQRQLRQGPARFYYDRVNHFKEVIVGRCRDDAATNQHFNQRHRLQHGAGSIGRRKTVSVYSRSISRTSRRRTSSASVS